MKLSTLGVIGLAASMLAPVTAGAQACFGTPRGTSVAYEYGKLYGGNSHGIAAQMGGLKLGARLRDIGDDLTGQEADIRFAVVLGSSRVSVCPLISLGFQRDAWDFAQDSKLTSNTLTAMGGVALGTEFNVYQGLSAIPFIQVAYRFSAIHFDLEVPNSEPEVTGDTVSVVDIEYGLVGRYKNFFAGLAATRNTDSEGSRPVRARWIFGYAFSGGGSSSRAAPLQPRSVRAKK